jgi:hypothetical protein
MAVKAKVLFLVLFVPLHAWLTLHVLWRAFNPPAGGHSFAFHVVSVWLAAPLLLPLVVLDPDGERVPRWLQMASLPINSLVAGLAILWCISLARRLRSGGKTGS